MVLDLLSAEFDNILYILFCPDRTVSPVPPGDTNKTCPEFGCLDGSCIPFTMVGSGILSVTNKSDTGSGYVNQKM